MVAAPAPGSPEPPVFSVVIPARNAAAVIRRTLEGLAAQRRAPPFEVVVVDDGSTDGTARRAAAAGARVISVAAAGPAAARNAGIAAAAGARVALLGADTVPEPGWLAAHAAAHRRAGDRVAFVGRIDWHAEVRTTPFLRWVNEQGPQFGYGLIRDPESIDGRFFYSSNASLAAETLRQAPFDERFGDAAWEDVELGLRLREMGTRIAYLPTARVQHLHPTDLRSFLRRQRRVGAAALTFRRVRPDSAPFLHLPSRGAPLAPPRWLLGVAERIGAWADARGRDPRPLWRILCHGHYLLGARQAWSEAGEGDSPGGRP